MINNGNIFLRSADEKDVDLIYNWANDDEVRKNSFSTEQIAYENHVKWYQNALKSDNIKIFILTSNNDDIGIIRLNIYGDSAEVSYSISSDYRCMGYGEIMLKLIALKVKCEFPDIKKLIAKVKPENIASKKALLNTGYIERCSEFQFDVENYIINEKSINDEQKSGGVLFLTNNLLTIELSDWIKNQGYNINICSDKIYVKQLEIFNPKIIISYAYRYIIKPDVIEYMNGNIINLHCSFLPWNRGASPNIWSFFDNTPKGVTIHKINEKLDTGDILYQKECFFDASMETFASTYKKLQIEIMELFKLHWDEIYNGKYLSFPQTGMGTYHKQCDLDELKNKINFEYSDNIAATIDKYKRKLL